MNWLDFIFVAIIILGAFMGLRIGLIGATFTVAGIIIGALLAGQFSERYRCGIRCIDIK